jgi:hypothetical protein
MSTRYNNGSHYENHQRAKELHDEGEHAHRTGEQHGKQEHLTGHEQSKQALEHSADGHPHAWEANGSHAGGEFGHEDIAALALQLWKARGCPEGSPEVDWFQAVKQLRSRALAHSI